MSEVPRRNGQGIDLLADPIRRRIIAALALHPWRPSEVAAEIGLSRPATTRQLHLLRDAGLIRAGRSLLDGRVVLFYIEQRQLGRITAWLAGTEIGRPTTPTPGSLAAMPGATDARPVLEGLPDREDRSA